MLDTITWFPRQELIQAHGLSASRAKAGCEAGHLLMLEVPTRILLVMGRMHNQDRLLPLR
jgi:hypothetical protein